MHIAVFRIWVKGFSNSLVQSQNFSAQGWRDWFKKFHNKLLQHACCIELVQLIDVQLNKIKHREILRRTSSNTCAATRSCKSPPLPISCLWLNHSTDRWGILFHQTQSEKKWHLTVHEVNLLLLITILRSIAPIKSLLLGMPLTKGFYPPKAFFKSWRLNGKSNPKPIFHSHSHSCKIYHCKLQRPCLSQQKIHLLSIPNYKNWTTDKYF